MADCAAACYCCLLSDAACCLLLPAAACCCLLLLLPKVMLSAAIAAPVVAMQELMIIFFQPQHKHTQNTHARAHTAACYLLPAACGLLHLGHDFNFFSYNGEWSRCLVRMVRGGG